MEFIASCFCLEYLAGSVMRAFIFSDLACDANFARLRSRCRSRRKCWLERSEMAVCSIIHPAMFGGEMRFSVTDDCSKPPCGPVQHLAY